MVRNTSTARQTYTLNIHLQPTWTVSILVSPPVFMCIEVPVCKWAVARGALLTRSINHNNVYDLRVSSRETLFIEP